MRECHAFPSEAKNSSGPESHEGGHPRRRGGSVGREASLLRPGSSASDTLRSRAWLNSAPPDPSTGPGLASGLTRSVLPPGRHQTLSSSRLKARQLLRDREASRQFIIPAGDPLDIPCGVSAIGGREIECGGKRVRPALADLRFRLVTDTDLKLKARNPLNPVRAPRNPNRRGQTESRVPDLSQGYPCLENRAADPS